MGCYLGQPAGASPLHPTPFSLLRQRERGKEKGDPRCRRRSPAAIGSLRCSKARPGAERTPFAALTAFERPRRVSSRGALTRAGLSLCAPRLGIGGPPNSQQPNSPDFNQSLRFAGSPMRCLEAQEIGAACASTPPHPDRRGRSNAVSAANGVRSAPGSVLRALRLDTNSPEGWLCLPKDSASGAGTQGTPAAGWGCASGSPFSFPHFSLATQREMGSGCGVEDPTGSHPANHPQELNSDINEVTQ